MFYCEPCRVEKMKPAIHRMTGESALVMKLPRGLLLAQFDRLGHRHSGGWHLYTRSQFKVLTTNR